LCRPYHRAYRGPSKNILEGIISDRSHFEWFQPETPRDIFDAISTLAGISFYGHFNSFGGDVPASP
jgi:uncharacterized linocin/CFP29 family protein